MCFLTLLVLCCSLLTRQMFFLFYNFSTRVFLLGPSHHYYTPKCALSVATVYKTPIGDLPIDLEGIFILIYDFFVLLVFESSYIFHCALEGWIGLEELTSFF